MSISLIKGVPIAKIKSKSDLNNTLVYFDEEEKDEIQNMMLKGDDSIEPIPYVDRDQKQRSGVYISGPSGAGKSTLAVMLALNLEKLSKKKKQIILITDNPNDDPVFKKIEDQGIDFVKLLVGEEGFMDLSWTQFNDCIVIFDDFDSSEHVKLRKFCLNLVEAILKNGRKNKCDCIVITHLTTNYKDTRTIIFECDTFYLFPRYNFNATCKFLKGYLSFDDEQLKMVKAIKSRWVGFHKSVPMYMISMKSIKML